MHSDQTFSGIMDSEKSLGRNGFGKMYFGNRMHSEKMSFRIVYRKKGLQRFVFVWTDVDLCILYEYNLTAYLKSKRIIFEF